MRSPFGMIYYFVQMSGINSLSRKELENNIYIYIYLFIHQSSLFRCLFEDVGNSHYKR